MLKLFKSNISSVSHVSTLVPIEINEKGTYVLIFDMFGNPHS